MDLFNLKSELNHCVHCGRCLSVCPIYQQNLWEGASTRGKLSLLKAELSGRLHLGARMKDLLSNCLLCGACAEACASGVKGDELIQSGRAMALQGGGLSKMQHLLSRDLLGRGPVSRNLWDKKSLFLKKVPADSGLHFRFPFKAVLGRRWLPTPADRPFMEESRERVPQNTGGLKVGLFVGCVANFLRPQTARAAVKVLEAAGCRVLIPKDQVCCGKPALGAGDPETALYLAKKNIAAFSSESCDVVVSYCATCSEMLKGYGPLTSGTTDDALPPIMDLSAFLRDRLGWRPEPVPSPEDDAPLKVFYHDPCHLRRKQGVLTQPRELLQDLSGVELVGSEEASVCCGYGGIFNLWHYDLSLTLFQERLKTITPHQPQVVATSCSGCWLQFQDGLHANGSPVRAIPLIELLARPYEKE